MTDSILDAMTEQYNSMTRSGKKLANYILSNTAETQYLSITSLAENSGVSEATITRFCRMLGLNGYHELKLALAKSEPGRIRPLILKMRFWLSATVGLWKRCAVT